ncbi:MAG TPA: SDR family oxidoreductase [Steroidobacteraceae bacterium]|nr:SDR family oxidoreductase [Steroidobacteraceae bacterium]
MTVRKIAVVTGTTHGIGRVTSRGLTRAGYAVVMVCRDLGAATQLCDELAASVPAAELHAVHCDLASLESVRRCAATVRRDFGGIALLINNAGMVSTLRRRSPDGFELCFATNHLGPFLLTRLLLDRIAAGGRIVNVASWVHYRGRLDLASVEAPAARYRPRQAYAQSKLANVMFSFALARRLAGYDVTVNCLHPGVVATHLLPRWLRAFYRLTCRPMIDAERGAQTSLYLALSEEVASLTGRYFDEHQREQPASPLARDLLQQERLWEASERWTGLPPLP